MMSDPGAVIAITDAQTILTEFADELSTGRRHFRSFCPPANA